MELVRVDTSASSVVRVSGSVRPLDAPHLRLALAKALSQGPACVVCDLSGVTGLDPLCVAVFVAAQWSGPWPGPVVWLVGAQGQPAAALRATGTSQFLALANSVQAAHAQQAAQPPLLRDQLTLAPLPTAPRRARQFTAEVLGRWSVPQLAEDATLIVSELVTNGVQHAGTDLEVRLEHGRGLLRIAVRDHAGLEPRQSADKVADLREAEATMGEHGRGLGIVRALADGCGRTRAHTGGSVYWATLRTKQRSARPLSPGSVVGKAVTETVVVNARRDLRHPGHGWTVRLQMAWRPEDPQNVTLTLFSDPPHPVLPTGSWRIRRESLRRGLTDPVRDRNVALHPTEDRRAVLFDMRTGQLVRSARVPAQRVQRFLENLS
jgi:anti-sigma regulatory factor (Ser/Thr protein kinase)/anti-anti-sigma regulatory factor